MYSQRITREHPSAIIFMVDQSGSMAEKITHDGITQTKGEKVTHVLNDAISELMNRCCAQDEVYDYYHLSVLGYSGSSVKSLLHAKKDFVTCSELHKKGCPIIKSSIRQVNPQSGALQLRSSIEQQWIKPQFSGSTPMGAALERAQKLARSFSNSHPHSFPVMIINLTDGAHSDATRDEIIEKAEKIKSLGTLDGNTLLINIHVSSYDLPKSEQVIFPSHKNEALINKSSELLYDISSIMPDTLNEHIASFKKLTTSNNSFKAMSYNALISDLFYMINIGSTTLSLI